MTTRDCEINLEYDTEQIIEAINEVTDFDAEYTSPDDGEHFFWYLNGEEVEFLEDMLSFDDIEAVNKYLEEEFGG